MRDRLLHGFWLGSVHVDPLTGSVSGNGVDAHLPSRAIEILLVLARQPGVVVERDELLREVWGDGQGSAEALSHAVSELRHGLGDHADHPAFVQTVRRRGYRLVLEPRLKSEPPPAAEERTAEPDGPMPFWRELMQRGVVQAGVAYLVVGWVLIQVAGETFPNLGFPPWATPFVTYVVVAGFPVLVVLAWFLEFAEGRMTIDRGERPGKSHSGLEHNYPAIVVAYLFATFAVGAYQATIGIAVPQAVGTPDPRELQAALPIEPDSIAVLRFLNITDSPEARIFSDGLAEDVLDRLARVPGLSVSSRGDAWSLPEHPSSDEVRRRLRVAYFLEGSVRLVANNLRVAVQLIDTESGFNMVSRTFERKLEDFMVVQREITDLTVASLRVALPTETQSILAASYTDTDPDVYKLYRLGREIFERPTTVESMGEAIDYFQKALALDPGYAAAHAGLCRAYVDSYTAGGKPEFIERAERSCATALSSNPNLHMVYTALGELYRETNRVSLAEEAYNNALQRNSKDVPAILGLARVYEQQNRLEEAEGLLQRAIRGQPGNWRSINALGSLYFATGQYESSADSFRKIVYLDPENWQVLGNLGVALAMVGRFDEAADALERSLVINPLQDNYSNLANIYYYLGSFDEAIAIHRQALEQDPNANFVWLNLADALYFSGDEQAANEAFRKAAELSEQRLDINAGDTESLYAVAWATSMLGDPVQARRLMDHALAESPNDPRAYYYDSLVRARSSDLSGAVDAVERAVAAGYPKVMLIAEPHLAELRDEERFVALVSRADES